MFATHKTKGTSGNQCTPLHSSLPNECLFRGTGDSVKENTLKRAFKLLKMQSEACHFDMT